MVAFKPPLALAFPVPGSSRQQYSGGIKFDHGRIINNVQASMDEMAAMAAMFTRQSHA